MNFTIFVLDDDQGRRAAMKECLNRNFAEPIFFLTMLQK